MTDLEIAHGCDHVDHMGTESWRRDQVTRIEADLDAQPEALVA